MIDFNLRLFDFKGIYFLLEYVVFIRVMGKEGGRREARIFE